MSGQSLNTATTPSQKPAEDLLEKQYHSIGIHAVAAAACVKKPKAPAKKADYTTLSEEIMTD